MSHLNRSRCSPLRPRCCRSGCRAGRASHLKGFCCSQSFDPALSRCSTATATRIRRPSCLAVDDRIPAGDGKSVSIKSVFTFSEWGVVKVPWENLKNKRRQFFNFDLRYLSVYVLPYSTGQSDGSFSAFFNNLK